MRSLRTWLDEKRRNGAPRDLGAGFRALFDSEYLGIGMLAPSGRFLMANQTLQRMLGYDEAELAALNFNEVTYREDIAACDILFGRLQRSEIDHFEMEKRYVRKDGAIVWAHVVVSAVRERGRLLHTVGIAVDITRRKRAEESVRRMTTDLEARVRERTVQLEYHTALLSAVQEASPDGFAVIDHEKERIITCNQRFVEMWSLPPEIVASGSLGRILDHILPQLTVPERAKALAAMKEFKADRERRIFDETALSDGRIFEFYSCPISGAGGRHFGRVSYWHDVTRRARAEADLRDKSEALIRSNVDLDMFAYAAAHDLNAPLRRIIGFGDILRENLRERLDPAAAQLLTRMREGAAGMSKLITDVLAFSRVGREPLPLEEVDLDALAATVVADLRPEIDAAGAKVEAGPLPVIRAHPTLLRRVLQNLISNALKFRRRNEPPRVAVESRRTAEGFVEISVADNGIGFEQKDAEKVFEPFVRLQPAGEYPGSGIGLAICRRIAERYGGRISAVSEPDKGTVVTLTLPASMVVTKP
jgi:PAS domain S-box-containing protein